MTEYSVAVEGERKLLQKVVAVAALAPIIVGAAGIFFGPTWFNPGYIDISAGSQYRYLSGVLLGVGLCFWSTVPEIELKAGRFRLLTLLIVIGGLSRLLGLLLTGIPSLGILIGLAAELFVAPILALWQTRVASRCREERDFISPVPRT